MLNYILAFQLHELLNPKFYLENGGLFLLLLIVFAETGLFVGFFFPGDSLLFVAGIFVSRKELPMYFLDTANNFFNLFILIFLVSLAGIFGNIIGYLFGKRIGPAMFHWKDNLLFKKKHLYQAHEFYEKYGGGAVVFARFVPILRTFAPIVAGIVKMDKKKFLYYNIIGCIAWVSIMISVGYFLQDYLWVKFKYDLSKHLEVIVLGIVFITTAPVLVKLIFGKTKSSSIPK